MAVNLDNLTICPQKQAEIIGKTVRQNTILQYFTPHTGYKIGAFTYRFIEAGGNFVDCCEEGDGELNASERDGRTSCFKYENKWCGELLQEALNDFDFRVTAGNERIDGRLTDAFAEEAVSYVSNLTDEVVVKGDVDSADPNLKKIDGILKQATEEGGVIITYPTSTNLYQAIKEGVRALPADARKVGEVVVFMPLEWGDVLQDRLINQNLFHYNPGTTNGVTDSFTLPGIANVRVVPSYGFSGTGQILITPRINNHWFTNLAPDKTSLYFGRCECADRWLERIKFILGVLLLRPDWSVVMTISDDIINAPFCVEVCANTPAAEAVSAIADPEILQRLYDNVNLLTQLAINGQQPAMPLAATVEAAPAEEEAETEKPKATRAKKAKAETEAAPAEEEAKTETTEE